MVIQGKIFEYAMEVVLTESRRRLHTYLQTSEHTLTECLLPTDGAILKCVATKLAVVWHL